MLQVQLTIDFFIFFFLVLLTVWPKGGAVAQAAFRESVRQPMFWLLFGFAFVAMWIYPYIPYFTFGEDHIMVKELGYDTIMLVAAIFGTLAASMFVSEEIEGRTAVTLMSKPVSRRQFLLGKFVGIMLAVMLMFGLLGCSFEGVLLYKNWFDRIDPGADLPPWVTGLSRQSVAAAGRRSRLSARLRLLGRSHLPDAARSDPELLPGHGAGGAGRRPGHAVADGR